MPVRFLLTCVQSDSFGRFRIGHSRLPEEGRFASLCAMSLKNPGGMSYILLSSVLWASFPVITTLGFHALPVFTSAALTTFFSTLFFFTLVLLEKRPNRPSKQCIRQIVTACILIGIGYYFFTYVGISLTTPGNAAIVMLMEIFFSYLFISVIGRHEPLIPAHVFGALLMIGGVLFVLVPSAQHFRSGDFVLLVGSMLPPLGNLAMQRARKEVSAAYIMLFRSMTGTLSLGILALAFEGVPDTRALVTGLPVILIGGFLLMGLSKILWIEAIHRLPITQTISVASIQPLFTMLFAYILLGQIPEWVQLLSLPPVAAGMVLLTQRPSVSQSALEEV